MIYEPSTIEGEIAYPIFRVDVKWHEPIREYVKQGEGCPEGRGWNGTSKDIMFQDPISDADIDKWCQEVLENQLKHARPKAMFGDIAGGEFSKKLLRHETWCLYWFNHWTFDVGQSDQEVLRSFGDYVGRMECLNEKHRIATGKFDTDLHCLMGAEDRWRWRGKEDGSPPPCRCDQCKKNGLIHINH